METSPAEPATPARASQSRDTRSFFRWGAGVYLATFAVLFFRSLVISDGHIVYLTDDPAIHLTVSGNLVHHGTWGVVPGHFQSASSSPLWTVLLALGLFLLPFARNALPMLLNVAAGLWVVWLFAVTQQVIRPGLKRPLDVAAVAALVVFVLFLPALTMLGMEHTLQMALVLCTVVLFKHQAVSHSNRWPKWLPYVLLGLSVMVRLESLFIAAGIGVALLVNGLTGLKSDRHREQWPVAVRRFLLVVISSAGPFAAFVFVNRLMGQGFLPNSVLAKGQSISHQGGADFKYTAIFQRFTADPLLAAITVVVFGCLVLGWRERRAYVLPATVFLVAATLHVVLAQVGFFERYQAYLIALGAYTLLAVADEISGTRSRQSFGPRAIPMLVLVALLLAVIKIDLTKDVPIAVRNTYEQRYQAARFLHRYYDHVPIATGELGYASLFHRGPITDLFGLGDYEVLQARRAMKQDPPKGYWADLARRRRFPVVAMYPFSLKFSVPDNWILVGEWSSGHRLVTAFEPKFQFWATTPEAVRPMKAHLQEFAPELAPGVTSDLNPLAELRADQLLAHR